MNAHLDELRLLVVLPSDVGKVVGMVQHQGRIILATEVGGLFELKPDATGDDYRLEHILLVDKDEGMALYLKRSDEEPQVSCPACKGAGGTTDATSMKGVWMVCAACKGEGRVAKSESSE